MTLLVLVPPFLECSPYLGLTQFDFLKCTICRPQDLITAALESDFNLALIPEESVLEIGGLEKLPWGVISYKPQPTLRLLLPDAIDQIQRLFIADDCGITTCSIQKLFNQLVPSGNTPQIYFLPDKTLTKFHFKRSDAIIRFCNNKEGFLPADWHRFSLADIWSKQNAVPFRSLVWAAPENSLTVVDKKLFVNALTTANKQLVFFVRHWAEKNNLNRDEVQEFVVNNVRYQLDTECKEEFNSSSSKISAIRPLTLGGNRSTPIKTGASSNIDDILTRASERIRLSVCEVVAIYYNASLADLLIATTAGELPSESSENSSQVVCEINLSVPKDTTTVFSRPQTVLITDRELEEKLLHAQRRGATRVRLLTDASLELGLGYFQRVIHDISSTFPMVIEALNPREIIGTSRIAGLSIHQTLECLKQSGLGGLCRISPTLISPRAHHNRDKVVSQQDHSLLEWLEVQRCCHALEIETIAGLSYRQGESFELRGFHLLLFRLLQDESRVFSSFVFTPPPQKDSSNPLNFDTDELIRLQAIGRLFFDNIPRIETSVIELDPEFAQVAFALDAQQYRPNA